MKRLNLTLSLLLDDMKKVSDEGRDIPVRWNVMHMYSCAQLAKLIAIRRGIDPELAGMAAALHDIVIMITGKRKDHAQVSSDYVYEFIDRLNNGPWNSVPKVTMKEADKLVNAIMNHSQKEIDSGDPFVELLKDIDCLDSYLHGINESRDSYIKRTKKALDELGIIEDLEK